MNDESLYLIKNFNFRSTLVLLRLAIINMSSVRVLRVTSEYSFTDLGRMNSLIDGWFVVSASDDGIRIQGTSQDSKHCTLITRPHHLGVEGHFIEQIWDRIIRIS